MAKISRSLYLQPFWLTEWIFEQATARNKVFQEAIDIFLDDLRQFLMYAVSLVNPQVMLLDGGIMQQVDYFKKRLNEKKNLIQISCSSTK